MTHVMTLVEKKKSGYSEYRCPVPGCGRHILICFNPFDRIVMQPGNETEVHTGSAGMPGVDLWLGAKSRTGRDEPLDDWINGHTDLFDWSGEDGTETE